MNPVDYLNQTVWCKIKPSPIEGIGVFAIRDIPKGARLTDYYGGQASFYEIQEDSFKLLNEDVKNLILERTIFDQTKPLIFMSPNCNQIIQAFMNHSDDANSDGIYALRDIKKGEEVTENYKTLPDILHSLSMNMVKNSSK